MFHSVGIVIPVFSKRLYLLHALNSLRNQKLKPDELVLIDDANCGDIKKILKYFKKIYRGNIKVLENNEPLGISLSTFKGIENMSSDYIAFMDSDDILLEKAIMNVKHILKNRSYDCMSSNFAYLFTQNKNIVKRSRITQFPNTKWIEVIGGHNYFSHFKIIKRSLINDFSWERNKDGIQDALLNFHLSKPKFKLIEDVLYLHRVHQFQHSKNFSIEQSKQLNVNRRSVFEKNKIFFRKNINITTLMKYYRQDRTKVYSVDNEDRLYEYKHISLLYTNGFNKLMDFIINLDYFTFDEVVSAATKIKLKNHGAVGILEIPSYPKIRFLREFWGIFDCIIVQDRTVYNLIKVTLPAEAPVTLHQYI